MKYILLSTIAILTLSLISCKRVCYSCNQYCAYCISKADSTVAYKICTNGNNASRRVDSVRQALQANNYYCNLLTDDKSVCDTKQAIDEAVIYFQKQDYYCQPKE